MKIKLVTILFLNSLISLAQSDKVLLNDLAPFIDKNAAELDKNHFPEIKYPNKRIAEKINSFLQLDYLEHVPGVYKKSPFEKVEYDEKNCCSYTNFQAWEKYTTPKNILCLKIEGEASGAYPEYFEQYQSFDITTGNRILIKDMLNAAKTKELTALLNQKVKKEIDDFLVEIKDSLARPTIVGEERERYGAQDTLYNQCLRDHENATISYYEYYFTKDSITFVLGRCSNHAMRAIDDLDRYYIPIAYTDFEKYLSPYGKSLFSNNTSTIATNSPEGKIFKGTIANIPITLVIAEIDTEDSSFTFSYWYDKHKIPIEWNGNFHNNHFSIKEYNNNQIKTATVEADWISNKIIGTWRDINTGKVLKLELVPY